MTGFTDIKDGFDLQDIQTLQTQAETLYLGTWQEIEGVVYGARPDSRGDIGGGSTYTDIITSGDITVTNYTEFVNAISSANVDDVIFIPETATIDFTGQNAYYINKRVTIASNRGANGSTGGVIKSDTATDFLKTIVLSTDGIRFTGLDIIGPSGTTAAVGATIGLSVESASCEIDNCDIHNWPYAGVRVDNSGTTLSVHHCDLYDNLRDGYGYGVSANVGTANIDYNRFGNNRHNIAGGGAVGNSWSATNNVSYGAGTNIFYDMHADGGDGGTAGDVTFENNYIGVRDLESWGANNIRGIPRNHSYYRYNWYVDYTDNDDAMWIYSGLDWTNVTMTNNIFRDGLPSDGYGSELIVGGTMDNALDWYRPAIWTIADSVATCADVSSYSSLTQVVDALEIGKTYRIEFEIVTITSGSVRYSDQVNTGTLFDTVGVHSEEITAGAIKFGIQSQLFNGTIDNVSCREVLI